MLELRITWDEKSGDVNVQGPINNKGMCYLMLECARDVIHDHVASTQKVTNGKVVVLRHLKRKR
jgi:hypothetical protein